MKNSLRTHNSTFELAEESINLKISQLRISSMRNRDKNIINKIIINKQ